MILVKTVSDEGRIDLKIDSKDLNYALSRELTGTTNECEAGVFNGTLTNVWFEFGDFKATIYFNNSYSAAWHIDDLAPIIFGRIKKVCEWVADCKLSGGHVSSDEVK